MRGTPLALAGLVALPALLSAQSGQSSARAIGMSRSLTAAARGYEAIAWNPALLGAPGRPKFSINIAQVGIATRSNALSATQIWSYYGQDSLSVDDRNEILDKVRATDDSTFGVGALADVMALGVTVGNFGIALTGTAADASVNVSDDVVELILFGNTARRAPFDRYDAEGSRASGVSAATLAVSWGQGFQMPVGHLAVGITAKLRRGIMAARAAALNSYVQNAPDFEARAGYHALYFDPDRSVNNGTGFGVDFGASYDFVSGLRVAAAVENLVSSMSWKDENLRYIREEYLLEQSADGFSYQDVTIADIDAAYDSLDTTQRALRDSVLGRDPFATKLRLGAQLSAGSVLLAGDAEFELTDGIVPGASSRASVGAELPITVLILRGGVATDFAGLGFSAGLGFKLGPVRLDVAGALTPGGERKGLALATGLSIMN